MSSPRNWCMSSEAEAQYAKSLSKLSGKLVKASKEALGSVSHSWQLVGAEMEAESEIHRALSVALSEEVSKPLRTLLESHHRTRKQVEAVVEKAGKSLAEWRAAEAKTKKHSFLCARENERLQDASLLVEARLGRASRASSASSNGAEKSPFGSSNTNGSVNHHNNQHHLSEKELAKLESKRRKAEEAVRKADVEYYTFSIRAERARLEWETAVNKGSQCFQQLEEERLQNLKELAARYLANIQEVGPKLVQSSDRLTEPILRGCDVARDMSAVSTIRGSGQPIPEQLLPDFYAEHITLAMNRERRRQNLVKLLQLIRSDVERERRGKQGVENLARALQQTPTFGSQDSQQNVTEKLHHMCSMLTYLEAARYKVQSALAELDGRQRAPHPLAPHITVTRDRQGLQQSVLKLSAGDSPDWTDRGKADGNSVQPDSDFDEFSSQGSDKEYQSSIAYPVISENGDNPAPSVGRCRALYDYAPNLYDELKLRPGDVINIHDKQADGWWLGELNGTIGIFPATYVEEIK
ncbi:hypothetical protein J437_LFUL014120 [Ladona fulva]|uniref:Nostrin n=1 Tax=Ladona fulva TaxID=123851 RepID=A0A8K0KG22_LADFU|nr:hypothetical protein J437_LFUL014120 [Ladona fulva]